MIFWLSATALLSLILAAWLRERTLYVIFLWAYVQNFALPWIYTSRWAGKETCQALLLSKEFLLLLLFLFFVPQLSRCGGGQWPVPLRVLGYFTVWCIVRYAVAVFFQGESLFGNLWNLRIACFPFEVLTVGVGVAWANPEFANRFIRHMVVMVAGLAAVGILLYLVPGADFWRDHVDIASYNIEVKSESPDSIMSEDIQAAAEGIGGNGLARVAFSSLSPFRAFGTVGDSVGFGHFLAYPVLLLALWLPRNWKTKLMIAVTSTALFFSFTRSAWISVAIGFTYVWLRKKRFRLVFGLFGAIAAAVLVWTPMAEWYSTTLTAVSWGDPEDPHAAGIVWFYKQGLWQFENLIGQGMTVHLPEGGYPILLIRFGVPAVLALVCFCVTLYQILRQTHLRERPLFLIAQTVPLAMLVNMNFSYYQFNFIPYVLVWFLVGSCLAWASAMRPPSQHEGGNFVANAVKS